MVWVYKQIPYTINLMLLTHEIWEMIKLIIPLHLRQPWWTKIDYVHSCTACDHFIYIASKAQLHTWNGLQSGYTSFAGILCIVASEDHININLILFKTLILHKWYTRYLGSSIPNIIGPIYKIYWTYLYGSKMSTRQKNKIILLKVFCFFFLGKLTFIN